MFNNIIFNRVIGFIIIFGMIFASMVLSLSPAMAEGEEAEPDATTSEPEAPIVYPTIDYFAISGQSVENVSFDVYLSEELELNSNILYLYKKGDSTIVDQIDKGSALTFTVNRPSEGFEEYYVSVGDQQSEMLVVFSIENNDWNLTATVDKTVFSTSDTVLPKISWSIEKPLGLKRAFLVETTTNTILGNSDLLNSSLPIKMFYDDFKTYKVYIADRNSSAIKLDQLKNVSASSNEIRVEIEPWSIIGSVDSKNYSVDNKRLVFNWESNQVIGGKRSWFLIDEDSQEIQKTNSSRRLSPKQGSFEIFPEYNNKIRNYKIYIADANTIAINKSELSNIVAESNLITTDHDDWEVLITANHYSFYTEDEAPVITSRTNQTTWQEDTYKYTGYICYVDVEKNETFYISSAYNAGLKTDSKTIPRFYTEKEKRYKVIIADPEGSCYGACKIPVNEIGEIYAESNIITIRRASWEIYTDKIVGYIDDQSTNIPWRTNQALSDKPSTLGGSKGVQDNYRMYIRNLSTDGVKIYRSVELQDRVTAGEFGGTYKDGQIVKYKMYLAKTDETATTFSQLQDIQAESDVITVRPTQWKVALTDVRYEDLVNGNRKYSIDFEINKNIKSSTQYSFYIASAETGKIHHGPDNTTSKGTSNFTVNQDEAGKYYAYIAEKIPGATNVSQFNDVQVISNGLFPAETLNDIYTKYYDSKRFAAGGNPSTSDCQQTCYGDPVNSFNGELFENTVDLEIDGAFPFNLSRTYSTLNKDTLGDFGYGWNFNYNMFLTGEKDSLVDSQYITVSQENGSIVAFAKEIDELGEVSYISAGTVKAELRYDTDSNSFIFERKDGTQFIFNNNGVLGNIKDRNNNQLTFTRNNGKITEISNGERIINIVWNGNLVSSASDGIHTVEYFYNSGNELTEVKHSKISNSKKYTYHNDHKIHKITHPNNGVYESFYDSENRVIKQIDPRGNETNFAYSNLKTIITLPDNSKIEEIYNNRGWLLSKTLGYSTTTTSKYIYEYSSSGDLVRETYPNNLLREYTYDSSGNIVFSRDSSGIFRFVYNEQNLLTTVINPMGNTYTNEYDDKGNLVKSIDYNGNTVAYGNDSKGRLNTLQEPNDLGTDRKTLYHYNNSGLLNKTTDTLGRESEIVYDNSLNVSKAIDPMGYETNLEYLNNNADLIKKVTYDNGSSVNNSYDNAGRLTKTIGIDGNVVEYTYDSMDNILSIKDVYGTTSYTYDSNNRVISTTNPKNETVQYEYNGLGLLTKTIYSNGSVFSNTYNNSGLLISSTDAKGNKTTYEYNSFGNLRVSKDALNRQTSYGYDALNRLTSVSAPQGSYSYKYDKNSQVISSTEPGNKTTKYEYDKNGNLINTVHPNVMLSLYEYNSENLLIKSVDRASKQKVYSYDDNDRVVKVEQPGKIQKYDYDSVDNLLSVNYNDQKTIDYEYDLTGKILSSQSSDGVVSSYAYDAIGNLTSRGPPGKEVSYDYSPYGEITSVNYPSGRTVNYTYNNLDQLTEVKSNNETLASYTYDANFNNVSTAYENGIVETNSFDTLNRLNGINVKNSNDESLYQRNLTYNTNGYIANTQSLFNGSKTIDRSYTYSPAGTILSVKNNLNNATSRYTHDVFDNLTSIGTANKFDYESNYSLSSSAVNGVNHTYTYDDLGNRTSDTSPDSNRKYEWNIDGTLKNVNLNDSLSVDYTYDNSGLMSSKTVDGELVDEYVWDTVSSTIPTMLEDSSNEYIYGLDNTPFAQIDKSTDEIHYLFGDERNSVVLATDDAGNSVLTREYDEYGNIIDEVVTNPSNSPPNAFSTHYAYAGEYLDADTGYYNLRARWYEPSTGSFLSLDPAFASTDDAYGYASGNPLTYTDPLGLWSTTVNNQSNVATGITGVIDGAIGFPVASALMNKISPGSVDNCSILYVGSNIAGNIGSYGIPGGGVAKGVAAVSVIGIAKATSKASTPVKAISKSKAAEEQLLREWDKVDNLPINPNSTGWSRGESPYKGIERQSDGNYSRTDFGTVKSRHWRNESDDKYASRNWTVKQKARMNEGYAPQRELLVRRKRDGTIYLRTESMELSHEPLDLIEGGKAYVMRWPGDHARVDPHRRVSYEYLNDEDYDIGGIGR